MFVQQSAIQGPRPQIQKLNQNYVKVKDYIESTTQQKKVEEITQQDNVNNLNTINQQQNISQSDENSQSNNSSDSSIDLSEDGEYAINNNDYNDPQHCAIKTQSSLNNSNQQESTTINFVSSQQETEKLELHNINSKKSQRQKSKIICYGSGKGKGGGGGGGKDKDNKNQKGQNKQQQKKPDQPAKQQQQPVQVQSTSPKNQQLEMVTEESGEHYKDHREKCQFQKTEQKRTVIHQDNSEDLQNLQNENQMLKRKVDELEDVQQNQIRKLEQEKNILKNQLQNQQKEFQEQSTILVAELKKHKDVATSLSKNKEDIESFKAQKEKQIKNMEQQKKLMQEDFDQQKLRMQSSKGDQDKFKIQIQQKDMALMESQKKLEDLERNHQQLTREKERNTKQIAGLEEKVNQLVRDNDKLAIELESRTSQLNLKLETWIERAQHYKSELESVQNDKRHFEHNLRIELDQKNELKLQVNILQSHIHQNEDIERRLKQKEKYCQELENEIDSLKKTIRKNPGQLLNDYEAQNTQELIFRMQNDLRMLQMEADTRKAEAEGWRNKAVEYEQMVQGRKHFEEERFFFEREIKDRDEIIRNLRERLEIQQKEIEVLNRRLMGAAVYPYY